MLLDIRLEKCIPIAIKDSHLCRMCYRDTHNLIVGNLKVFNTEGAMVMQITSLPLFHLCEKCVEEFTATQVQTEREPIPNR